MIRSLALAALFGAVASAAIAQGALATIPRGPYVCELPGDANGEAGIPQPGRSFTIESPSRYSTARGSGTYLRRGDRVVMTSGPRKGEKYVVISPGFLRELGPDNRPGRLRCVLEVHQFES